MAKSRKYKKPKFTLGGDLKQYGGAVGNFAAGALNTAFPGNEYGVKDDAVSIGSGALQGAGMGAAFGPVGAGVGALVGGITGFIGNDQAKARQEAAERQQRFTTNKMLLNNQGVKMAKGGKLAALANNAKGGSLKRISRDAMEVEAFTPGTDKVDVGPAKVDDKEIVDNQGRVFSHDRGFAQMAKKLEKQKSKQSRFGDANALIDAKLDTLFEEQESTGDMSKLSKGGRIKKFAKGGSYFEDMPPQDKPYNVKTDTVGLYKNRYKNADQYNLDVGRAGASEYMRNHNFEDKYGIIAKERSDIKQVEDYRAYQKTLPKPAEQPGFFEEIWENMKKVWNGEKDMGMKPQAGRVLSGKAKGGKIKLTKGVYFDGGELDLDQGLARRRRPFEQFAPSSRQSNSQLLGSQIQQFNVDPQATLMSKLSNSQGDLASSGIRSTGNSNKATNGGIDPRAISQLATFAPNALNAMLTNQLPAAPAPALESRTNFDRININDQLAGNSRHAINAAKQIKQGTAQAGNVSSNLGSIFSRRIAGDNDAIGGANRQNAQIQMNEAYLNQNAGARNTERINNQKFQNVQRKNTQLSNMSANFANVGEKALMQGRERNMMDRDLMDLEVMKKAYQGSGVYNRNFDDIMDEYIKRKKIGNQRNVAKGGRIRFYDKLWKLA